MRENKMQGNRKSQPADSVGDRATEILERPMPKDYPLPPVLAGEIVVEWAGNEDLVANIQAVGAALAQAGDIYRLPGYCAGLLLASGHPGIKPRVIDAGKHLQGVIFDRIRLRVSKDGKVQACHLPRNILELMLRSEVFLQQFPPLDTVVSVPFYLDDFSQTQPGYNDGGPGQRLLYTGDVPRIERGCAAITKFLDVMAFATNADRTNAVAFALTVMLRNHWAGAKPLAVLTGTKSHAGKDTIAAFATGNTAKMSIDYERTDWALRFALLSALRSDPSLGLVCVENARLDRQTQIASATLERFLTDPEPVLSSPKYAGSHAVKNHLVLAITTNDGTISEDLMNRALPIHLCPVGDVAHRLSPIGNPKHEFLPANRDQIEAELRGMIENWKQAGQPLDEEVRHPFTDWARTIGGILKVNGFTDFLGNYGLRKTADDPLRRGLGILGAARPGQWLRSAEWAQLAVDLGLVRAVIPEQDRHSDAGRERGIGVVLSAHEQETFEAQTDDQRLTLRLEKARRRFEGGQISTRYRFVVEDSEDLPEDPMPATN